MMAEIPAALRRDYREQKADHEDRLLAMGGEILELLAEAMGALADHDGARADAVARRDGRLDAGSRSLQDEIMRTLALQAPVASELRLIAAFFHINAHLRRMSGLCANVARPAHADRPRAEDPQLAAQLTEMAQHARRVIEGSLEAFARRDVALARSLSELDDPLDALNRSVFRRTAQLTADEEDLDWAMRRVLVARHLERMADHAVDIGEQTIFIVTGELEKLS
jgi:phosphate transport system protein